MRKRAIAAAVLVVVVLWTGSALGQDGSRAPKVKGAGTSMVAGGTGAPGFTPVITKFAFYAAKGKGRFECLALAPTAAAGAAGSGNFDANVMYVTGDITSVQVKGGKLVAKGTSTVTGLGAGKGQAFTFTATEGGPGATLDLTVSGMTFRETLLEGRIDF